MNSKNKIILAVVAVLAIAAIIALGIRNQMQKQPDDENVIKIGAILPMTGAMSEEGQKGLAAIQLAIEESNARRKSNKLVLIMEDGRFAGKDSLLAYKKLLNEHPMGMISPGTQTTQAIKNDAIKDGIPLLALDGTAGLSESGRNIFECWTPFFDVGTAAGNLASKLANGSKKALIAMNVSGGDDFKSGFLSKVSNCETVETYDQNIQDARGIISKVLSSNPKLICVFGFNSAYTLVLRQLIESGFHGILVTDANITHTIDSLPTSETISIYFVSQAFGDYVENPRCAEFISNMEEKYGLKPTVFSAFMYEMVNVLSKAIPDSNVSYKEICDNIYAIKDMETIFGKITFGPQGDLHLPFIFLQINDGKISLVK